MKDCPISDIEKRGWVHRIVVLKAPGQTDFFFQNLLSCQQLVQIKHFQGHLFEGTENYIKAIDNTSPWLIIRINAWSLKYTEGVGK